MKILFFSPHSDIWVHAFPEALVAESLQKAGHDIYYVTCDRILDEYCVSMSAAGLTQEASQVAKGKVCNSCVTKAGIINRHFSFNRLSLKEYCKDNLDYAAKTASGLTRENCFEFDIDQIPLGRIAAYEFLLQYKKSDLHFSDDEWSHYLIAFRNSVLTYKGLDKIFLEIRPDRLLLYNALYSVNNTAACLAKKHGASVYSLHAGGNLEKRVQTMILVKDHNFNFFGQLLHHWSVYKSIPASPHVLAQVTGHFIGLLHGNHFLVYSKSRAKAFDIRRFFQIRSDQKILVATMSSYDEKFAAESILAKSSNEPQTLFSSQIEWIKTLLNLMTKRSDLFLIVRVHPREFPNQRDSIHSEHAKHLKEAFSRLPANVAINWPTDGISLYNLAEETNVFLNAWSSAGAEMSMLGIPVVSYSKDFLTFPHDLTYVGITEHKYQAAIDQALSDGWSSERIRMAYRWYALLFSHSTIDLSDGFRRNPELKKIFIERAWRKIARTMSPDFELEWDCRSRPPYISGQKRINDVIELNKDTVLDLPGTVDSETMEHETRALKMELQRLLKVMYVKKPFCKKKSLYFYLTRFANSIN